MLAWGPENQLFNRNLQKLTFSKSHPWVSGRQLTNDILLILSHNKVQQKSDSGTCVKLLTATGMIFKSQLELSNFQLLGKANGSLTCSGSILLFEPKRWSCQSLLYESFNFYAAARRNAPICFSMRPKKQFFNLDLQNLTFSNIVRPSVCYS